MPFCQHLHLAQKPQELESFGVTHATVRMKSSNSKALTERRAFFSVVVVFVSKEAVYNSGCYSQGSS